MERRYEYEAIKEYFNSLNPEDKQAILFDLKQLKGLVLDQITVPDLPHFLVSNLELILNYLNLMFADENINQIHTKSLRKLIRDDVFILNDHDELTYGEKRTFGEYMNYIYNVVDYIENKLVK